MQSTRRTSAHENNILVGHNNPTSLKDQLQPELIWRMSVRVVLIVPNATL